MIRPALTLLLLATPAHAALTGTEGGCTPEARQTAYNQGYVQGVEDIKAQLAQATQQMQAQVQAQLNDQLAQLQRQRDADLGTRMRAAQEQALKDAAAAPMPPALTGGSKGTSQTAGEATAGAGAAGGRPAGATTSGTDAATPSSPASPAPAGLPANPADLPPGSSLTITNAERLPPELYAALTAYMAR